METIQRITELATEWYRLIGSDHHKDRDCHWHITTTWSYSQPPTYTVEHNGYIGDNISITCESYDAALRALKHVIAMAVEKETAEQNTETLEEQNNHKLNNTMNNLPQKLQENLLVLLEAARVGLDDADLFDYVGEQLDIADDQLSDIRDSLQTYLDSEAHD